MIVVDTSALYAVQFGEPEAQNFARLLRAERRPMIGAPTLFEFYLVVTGKFGPPGLFESKQLIERIGAVIINWDEDMAEIAAAAFLRYGRGRDKAKLNFGDCMSYALAKSFDAPLLFKGDDFAQTDIRSALQK
ncbi:MAG: type II toxin-antitoxin system VapC family toxin [Sphingomonadaceae bacterium]